MKLAISWVVVLLGVLFGGRFLLELPRGIFTIGSNDTELEIVAMLALSLSILPASILAIFRRHQAGIWLLVVASLVPPAAVRQELFMADKFYRSFSWPDFWGFILVGALIAAEGSFFILTSKMGWPGLNARRRVAK